MTMKVKVIYKLRSGQLKGLVKRVVESKYEDNPLRNKKNYNQNVKVSERQGHCKCRWTVTYSTFFFEKVELKIELDRSI
jgi:hypothetical protein